MTQLALTLGASAVLGFLAIHVAYLTGQADLASMIGVAGACGVIILALGARSRDARRLH